MHLRGSHQLKISSLSQSTSNMKTTFLLGLPRCGSLALSVIMNNNKCVAHHEGNDYGVMLDYDVPWPKTFAANAELYAATSKKNYLCCDTSVGIELLTARMRYPDAINNVQVLFVNSKIARCIDSYERIGITVDAGSVLHQHRKIVHLVYKVEQLGCKTLTIHKEEEGEKINGSCFFSPSQLTEIAWFTGAFDKGNPIEAARMESLRASHISMNPDGMKKSIEFHKQRMLDKYAV